MADSSIDARRLFAADVGAAANELINLTPMEQRANLVLPFHSQDRYLGPATNQTPSFCAVLAWCPRGWGIAQCSMSQPQLVAMHKLLALALSPGGYQTLLAVMNRQRIIGEMEEAGDKRSVEKLAVAHPGVHAISMAQLLELAGAQDVPWGVRYPIVGGALPSEAHPSNILDASVVWVWDAPGLAKRRDQFGDYSLAIFGLPGESKWALRFEGHHITVNLTFLRNDQTGEVTIHGTPLFLGAFPMIIPESPAPANDLSSAWSWMKGQNQMFSTAHHLRKFWLALPEPVRTTAFIAADIFPQTAPLLLDTPPPFLISSLATKVDPNAVRQFPHVVVHGQDLGPGAVWHLKRAYDAYISALNADVAPAYEDQLAHLLAWPDTNITLSWAGGRLNDFGTHHYSYVAVGPLLLEFLQSNQFSVQHDPTLDGNHIHGMFRDTSFDWTDPMAQHQLLDHLRLEEAVPHVHGDPRRH